jgi:hypothetical protein
MIECWGGKPFCYSYRDEVPFAQLTELVERYQPDDIYTDSEWCMFQFAPELETSFAGISSKK